MTADAYSSYWPTSSGASTDATALGGYWPAAPDDMTASGRSTLWKEASGASFHDLIDIINPLQHLPVVGTIYRWATGDEPGNLARVIGDGIYGGPMGLVTGLFNVISRDNDGDGEDLGEQVLTMAFGPGGHSKTAPDQGTSMVAEAKPAGATAPASITATKLADLTPASAAAAVDPSPAAAIPAAGSTRSVASVAALYRSTDPAARRVAAPAATANANPDHAPIPLARSATAAPAAASISATPALSLVAADPADDRVHQLSVQNAMLQRQILAGRSTPAPGTPQLVNTPIPLQLTGQTLPGHQRPAMAVAQQASAGQPATGSTAPPETKAAQAPAISPVAATVAAADPAKSSPAPAAPTDLAVGTPAEISQKMVTALDKYMRLQQQEHAAAAAAGSQIDVSP